MDLKQYLTNFFNRKKLKKSISWFSFWDKQTELSDLVYLGFSARLHKCKVGKYTRIKPGCVLKNVVIGNYCSFANDVMVGLGQHPTNLISTNSIFYKSGITSRFARHIEFQEEKVTYIGNDVWIGYNATIMGGSVIGDGAIVASGALVNNDVEPYTIVAGQPAKVIGKRFTDEQIEWLLQFKWWDKPVDWIVEHAEEFDNIDMFKSTHSKMGND